VQAATQEVDAVTRQTEALALSEPGARCEHDQRPVSIRHGFREGVNGLGRQRGDAPPLRLRERDLLAGRRGDEPVVDGGAEDRGQVCVHGADGRRRQHVGPPANPGLDLRATHVGERSVAEERENVSAQVCLELGARRVSVDLRLGPPCRVVAEQLPAGGGVNVGPAGLVRFDVGEKPLRLITGEQNRSAIGTLVERSSHFTILLHLPGGRHTAEAIRDGLIAAMSVLPAHLRRSLTWDQGSEMALHAEIAPDLAMPVFFCEKASPWQWPSNENTNGVLRDYFPKGSDLSVHRAEEVAAVAAELNERPRKALGWASPAELLDAFTRGETR
jgi:hypothetical protein